MPKQVGEVVALAVLRERDQLPVDPAEDAARRLTRRLGMGQIALHHGAGRQARVPRAQRGKRSILWKFGKVDGRIFGNSPVNCFQVIPISLQPHWGRERSTRLSQ